LLVKYICKIKGTVNNFSQEVDVFKTPKRSTNVLSNRMPCLPSMCTENSPSQSSTSSPSHSWWRKRTCFQTRTFACVYNVLWQWDCWCIRQECYVQDLFDKLIRNTVSNMRSACNNLNPPREPSNLELQDMATEVSMYWQSTQWRWKIFCHNFNWENLQPDRNTKKEFHVSKFIKTCLIDLTSYWLTYFATLYTIECVCNRGW
jgi:hypothetical protein